MEYIGLAKPDGGQSPPRCVFCVGEDSDEERLILHRGESCFVILNLYPYNPGHMMVVPYRHTNVYESLTQGEFSEMNALSAEAVRVLKRVSSPDGFNIGMNLGKTAGAGVDEHLHLHIVPRWNGDTNFMPVLSDTRVVPEALHATWLKLKEEWGR